MKIWTTLTGSDDVKVHLSRDAAVTELVDFLADCGVDTEVTAQNWEKVLARLNQDMEAAGEAGYNAVLKEHPLPDPRLVVEVSGDVVHQLHTDSPLLDGLEVAVITSGLDVHDDEIIEIPVGGGAPGEFTGSLTSVQKATDWDVGSAYEAIEGKAPGRGMGR